MLNKLLSVQQNKSLIKITRCPTPALRRQINTRVGDGIKTHKITYSRLRAVATRDVELSDGNEAGRPAFRRVELSDGTKAIAAEPPHRTYITRHLKLFNGNKAIASERPRATYITRRRQLFDGKEPYITRHLKLFGGKKAIAAERPKRRAPRAHRYPPVRSGFTWFTKDPSLVVS